MFTDGSGGTTRKDRHFMLRAGTGAAYNACLAHAVSIEPKQEEPETRDIFADLGLVGPLSWAEGGETFRGRRILPILLFL